MKYVKVFNTDSEYQAFLNSDEFIRPNLSYIHETDSVGFNPMALIISFTIDGVEYQAKEGMTWEEWVNSEYNTDGYYVSEMDNSIMKGGFFVGTETNYVSESDLIIADYEYLLVR